MTRHLLALSIWIAHRSRPVHDFRGYSPMSRTKQRKRRGSNLGSNLKRIANACPKCGARPYVVIKGVEYCGRCHDPLPSSLKRFVAFAWISLTRQVVAYD